MAVHVMICTQSKTLECVLKVGVRVKFFSVIITFSCLTSRRGAGCRRREDEEERKSTRLKDNVRMREKWGIKTTKKRKYVER